MPNCDKNGRKYAKISDLKEGQTVWLDGSFTCATAGPVTVLGNGEGAYFQCNEGTHTFIGQVDDETGYCIGVYSEQPLVF